MLGSTYPVLSAIFLSAFLGVQGNLVPTVHSNDGLGSNTEVTGLLTQLIGPSACAKGRSHGPTSV